MGTESENWAHRWVGVTLVRPLLLPSRGSQVAYSGYKGRNSPACHLSTKTGQKHRKRWCSPYVSPRWCSPSATWGKCEGSRVTGKWSRQSTPHSGKSRQASWKRRHLSWQVMNRMSFLWFCPPRASQKIPPITAVYPGFPVPRDLHPRLDHSPTWPGPPECGIIRASQGVSELEDPVLNPPFSSPPSAHRSHCISLVLCCEVKKKKQSRFRENFQAELSASLSTLSPLWPQLDMWSFYNYQLQIPWNILLLRIKSRRLTHVSIVINLFFSLKQEIVAESLRCEWSRSSSVLLIRNEITQKG